MKSVLVMVSAVALVFGVYLQQKPAVDAAATPVVVKPNANADDTWPDARACLLDQNRCLDMMDVLPQICPADHACTGGDGGLLKLAHSN